MGNSVAYAPHLVPVVEISQKTLYHQRKNDQSDVGMNPNQSDLITG